MTDRSEPVEWRKALEGAELRLASLHGILDSVAEAIYIQDREGRFLDVNAGASRMYGHPREFFLGKGPEAIAAPGRDWSAGLERLARAFAGEPQQFLFWGMHRDGRTFPMEIRLYPGQYLGQEVVIAIGQDISDRYRAERVRDAAFRIAEAAHATRDLDHLFASVHAIVRDLMPADNFYIAFHDRETGRVAFPYWVDQMESTQPARPFRRGLTEYVLRTGQAQLVDRARLDELLAEGEVEGVGPVALAWLGVPLSAADGVFGVLAIQSYDGGFHYGTAERDLLSFVSGQVAMAIERKRTEMERRLMATAINRAEDGIFVVEQDGRFVFVNEAACQGLGYAREELLAMRVFDLDPAVTPESWANVWSQAGKGAALRVETTQRRKDGSFRPVEVSRSFFTFENRQVLFAHVRDIQERQAAEAALRLSEAKFSKAFHASPDAINITRLEDGAYLDVSEGFTRLTGWTREESRGRSSLDMGIWVDPADRERVVALIREHGEFVGYEAPFRAKDGHIITGLMSGKLLEVEGTPCLLTFTRDITARKQAEAVLKATERRLWTVLKNSQAIIYQLDPEGRFLLSEGRGLHRLGLEAGQLIGRSALDLYRESPDIVDQLRRGLAGQPSREMARTQGLVFDNILTPVFDDRGEVESVIGIAMDVTEQQEAQAALVAERGLFVGGPVMVVRWRAAEGWPVDYVSPNVQAILGYPPEDFTSGRLSYDSLVHPEDLGPAHQVALIARARGATHYETQYRIRTASGEYRWFHDFSTVAPGEGAQPTYFLGYLVDITERRQAEEALRQAQKLESLGVLAGGIAHDFNNLLTAVLGNLNLAQMHLPGASPAQVYLENMERAVLKAAELTKQMLDYSGRGRFQVQRHDLNQAVQELIHLLEVSIPKKVALTFDLHPGLPTIEADGAQIQQVVMNLVTNASDAIGDREGRIRIATRVEVLEGDRLPPPLPGSSAQEPPLAPGSYVVLEVEDTGCGMGPDVLERIFDPFFTTKSTGRGLGLSAMLGILRGHRAGLRITSIPGSGSTFRLYFPASTEPPAARPEAAAEPRAEPLRGRVLVVDDEDLILATTGAALSAMGFEVVMARDGVEAVSMTEARGAELDLVLMDLTMPRMDGREAFRAMRRLRPDLPVILCSGFTEQDSMESFGTESPAAFIQKPYQFRELRRTILGVLGET